ncbi:MAG: antibiotic biosynthesis monooxygenase [Gammaproteobacteria bacterium]|nr:antibiotic biosynthesis monooxygenase [Gammaproteobacteria bacterium]
MDPEDNRNRPMTTMVEFQIRPENTSLEAWLDEWEKRADDAQHGEPETSAYAAAINLEDAKNVLVFERYVNGNSSLQRHVERPAHKTLTETMGERRMTKRRVMSSRYFDVADFGWWSRPETAEPTLEGAIIAILGFRFADDQQLATYLELASQHAAYCRENEPDTLIYSAGVAAADADRELDLLKGDVVFVMACTDMAAVEKHSNDPQHVALGHKFTELGIDPEPKFLRTYRTTGRGFLWRN